MVKMLIVIFWVVMPCSLVDGYQCSSEMVNHVHVCSCVSQNLCFKTGLFVSSSYNL
jgi:hypothetical protein